MIFISLITILTDFLQPRNQGIEQSTIQCISFAVPPRIRPDLSEDEIMSANKPSEIAYRLLCLLAHVSVYAIRPYIFTIGWLEIR